MTSDLAFRTAGAGDIPALHRLVESAYRGEAARVGWTHEADLLDGQRTDVEALAEVLADPKKTIMLAEAQGRLVGCVMLDDQGGGSTYLGMLSVEPGRQGGGLGRRLLAEGERVASGRFGANRVEMTVIRQRPELIAWYERRGYRLTGATAPFPMDDPRFGLPRRRDLAFVVLEKRL